MRRQSITPRFVEFIPDQVEDGILYVSETYKTAIHRCCCGCGEEVVTPLTPADWQMKREGSIVSLSPSIGNWNYPCQSHYWIVRNRIDWSSRMSQKQIRHVQERDRRDKRSYVARLNAQRQINVPWWRKLVAAIKSLWSR